MKIIKVEFRDDELTQTIELLGRVTAWLKELEVWGEVEDEE